MRSHPIDGEIGGESDGERDGPAGRAAARALPAQVHADKKIGPLLATFLVASSMIGSGIYLLPATLAQFGSMTTVGWLIAAAGALIVARVLARLGRAQPEAGGVCAYVGRRLGPGAGFQATTIYWLACWTGNIAIAVAAAGYLASLLPAAWSRPLPLALIALAQIWLFTAVNLLGARRVCQIESASLVVGLVPIVLVMSAGWTAFHPAIFRQSWNVSGHSMLAGLPPSLVLMFWAFAGVESASIATAIVREPERNVARATYGGVAIAAVIYLLACGVLMGILPAGALARSTAPFADALALTLGRGFGAAIAVLALAKTSGSLAGWILLTTQTSEAGAAHGAMPRWFATRWGLWLAAGLMSLGVLATLSPTLGEQFGELIAVSVILSLLLYLYACVAAWRDDRGFALAGMLFCAGVIAFSGERLLLWAGGILLLTLPLMRLRAARGGLQGP